MHHTLSSFTRIISSISLSTTPATAATSSGKSKEVPNSPQCTENTNNNNSNSPSCDKYPKEKKYHLHSSAINAVNIMKSYSKNSSNKETEKTWRVIATRIKRVITDIVICVTVNTLTEDILNYNSKDNKIYISDVESKLYNSDTLVYDILDNESNDSICKVKCSFSRGKSKYKLFVRNLMVLFILVPIENRVEKQSTSQRYLNCK